MRWFRHFLRFAVCVGLALTGVTTATAATASATQGAAGAASCQPAKPRPGGPLSYLWAGQTAHPTWVSAPRTSRSAAKSVVTWTLPAGIAFAGGTGSASIGGRCRTLAVSSDVTITTHATVVTVTIPTGATSPRVMLRAGNLHFTPRVSVTSAGRVYVRITSKGNVPLSFTAFGPLGQKFSSAPVPAGQTSPWLLLPKVLPAHSTRTISFTVVRYGHENSDSAYYTLTATARRP